MHVFIVLLIAFFLFSVIWYRKPNGKEVAMIQGYTFSLDGRSLTTDKYKCSLHTRCKARFAVTKDREFLTSSNLEHNHPPPKFLIRDGVYIKI